MAAVSNIGKPALDENYGIIGARVKIL